MSLLGRLRTLCAPFLILQWPQTVWLPIFVLNWFRGQSGIILLGPSTSLFHQLECLWEEVLKWLVESPLESHRPLLWFTGDSHVLWGEKLHLQSKNVLFLQLNVLSFTELNDVSLQSVLTFFAEGINLLCGGWKSDLKRAGPTSMICDITNRLEADPGPIFCIHKCDMKTRSPQCTYTEKGLTVTSVQQKYLQIHIFCKVLIRKKEQVPLRF